MDKIQINKRSIPVILCTLAIIGALSYAGIAAYLSNTRAKKADEIINEAFERAKFISTTYGEEKIPDVESFGQKEGWSLQLATPRQEQFSLNISEVDKEVCSRVADKAKGTTVRRVFSAGKDVMENGDDCSSATLSLIFNNDLSMHKYPLQPCAYFEMEDEDKCVPDVKKFEKFECPSCFKGCKELEANGLECLSECRDKNGNPAIDCCTPGTIKKQDADSYRVLCYYS